ncbi:hypothetical protein HZP84_02435 [Elizabethkingia anophelis]|jgi:hypothetical protein|uniref:Uncharacterized protein n=6 Tax=Elizabethkingia TaxID=308865 RepID=A0AAJ3TQY1_9FLAO|nr:MULTISPECIES: hypothetical protein [Elizabethkingia]MDR2230735.1 hypothetical protein [Flavobacteriaceae bacterium]AIL45523.1 hypothetical protein BD94_1748 [Elizabethkingia anophelis NUHP1]AKH94079.1 hypothetical protein M876_05820 [Elizabethkingia anophelis FMS-007]AMR40333.1 hypothetical protein A2T74_02675 [Elizabethkingia anophelis]AMX46965.1 hypothetical protein A4C56_02675 [Elizabethkingia anophelis]
MMIKENLKQEYSAPALDVLWLEMEQGIAAGSAKVVPPNSGGQVQEEWTQDPDDNRTIEW